MPDKSLEMTLPSLGLLYDGAIPGGVLKYGPMTGKEETLLSGGKGSVLDTVLAACLDMPVGFKPSNLLLNDRFFALIVIRSISYGEKYKFNVGCPACGTKFVHAVELPGDFEVKLLEEDAKEPFLVTLPASKKAVGFRLMRGEDELAIQRFTDRAYTKNAKVDGDPSYVFRNARQIVEVDGEPYDDTVKAMRFFEGLLGKDSAALRNAYEDADFGLDITLNIDCPRCDDAIEMPMPMSNEFFRPRP